MELNRFLASCGTGTKLLTILRDVVFEFVIQHLAYLVTWQETRTMLTDVPMTIFSGRSEKRL